MYNFAIKVRLVLIGFFIVRSELIGGDLLAQVEHRIEGFAAMVGKTRASRQGRRVEPFVEHEIEIPS